MLYLLKEKTTYIYAALLLTCLTIVPGVSVAQVVPAGGQAVAASPEQLSASFAEVAKRVGPAVVSIDTKGKTPEVTTRGEAAPGTPDDIMEFFRRQMPR